jgi:hypothetical protein
MSRISPFCGLNLTDEARDVQFTVSYQLLPCCGRTPVGNAPQSAAAAWTAVRLGGPAAGDTKKRQ